MTWRYKELLEQYSLLLPFATCLCRSCTQWTPQGPSTTGSTSLVWCYSGALPASIGSSTSVSTGDSGRRTRTSCVDLESLDLCQLMWKSPGTAAINTDLCQGSRATGTRRTEVSCQVGQPRRFRTLTRIGFTTEAPCAELGQDCRSRWRPNPFEVKRRVNRAVNVLIISVKHQDKMDAPRGQDLKCKCVVVFCDGENPAKTIENKVGRDTCLLLLLMFPFLDKNKTKPMNNWQLFCDYPWFIFSQKYTLTE